jgi:predicted PurR-regulated permease PerM
LYAAYQIRGALFVFVLAIFFSYLVYPPIEMLERHARGRLSRTTAAALVYFLVAIVLLTVLTVLSKQIAAQATELAKALPSMARDPHSIHRLDVPHVLGLLPGRLNEFIQEFGTAFSRNAMPVLRRVGGQLLRYAGNLIFLVLIPILSFLFVKYAPVIRGTLEDWFEGEADPVLWRNILTDLNTFMAHYVRAVLLLSLATFVAYAVFFTFTGVPYGLLLAGAAAFLELVPLLGPLTAAVLTLAVAAWSGFPHLLGLVLFLVAHRLFQDYVLNPFLMSSGVQLNPLLVIFGVLAGERLGGVPGVLLAIPVLGTARILASRLRKGTKNRPETDVLPGRMADTEPLEGDRLPIVARGVSPSPRSIGATGIGNSLRKPSAGKE